MIHDISTTSMLFLVYLHQFHSCFLQTKKISHTRRSPKDRNYPSTPFDKLPFYFKYRLPTNLRFIRNPLKFNICINCFKVFLTSQNLSPFMRT
ncbi:hypothetical protein GBP24_03525 [Pediococcus pentosaceus]|nr:hypothetical protein GBP24_03525 [Pediococcus pentosaceus]